MAERCDHVPMEPARTFDEGVQTVFFCYDFLSDAIGRLDQYLAPLYFADIAAGRTTRERAAERLQELFVFIDAHTPHASSNYDKGGECHMTVGGLTPDGKDGWTDFSRLVVESCMACDLRRPEMSLRWHPGTKREVLRFMLDCERRDPNMRIAFDGDVMRVPALEGHLGFPPEVARDYCITGCNEGAFPGGASTGGCKVNAALCIERIFSACRDDALACRTWGDFAALFEREILRLAKEAGLHAAIETSGFAPLKVIEAVEPFVDLWLYDIKLLVPESCLKHTGRPLAPVLENIRHLNAAKRRVVMRCPMIPGINDSDAELKARGELADELNCVEEVNVLPYVPYGIDKAHRLGLKVYEAPHPPSEYGPAIAAKLARLTSKPVRLP